MRLKLMAVALALPTVTAYPAMAQPAPGLAPSMPWNMHYDDDSCALRRVFREGENEAYLELRRFGPGTGLQVTVASKRMKPKNPASFRYRFDADAEWRTMAWAPTLSVGEDFSGVVFGSSLVELPEYEGLTDPVERHAYLNAFDLPALENEFAARTDTLVLRGAFRRDLALQIGSMVEPMKAMRTCIDELMTRWGIDVEAHKTLSRPAIPIDFTGSASMLDYPPKMLRRSMPGRVNIRLDIDDRGRVTDCHIQMPLSDPEFAESSCADIQHAFEFEPALDKDGKPIPSYWTTTVNYQMGG